MSAILSPCETYRYRLERSLGLLGSEKTVAFIMVNPSTADATSDDHTIRKVLGFAERAGASRVIVGNKFAHRAKDIKDLRTVSEPVGPENDAHLEQIMRDADLHVVAWGRLAKLPPQLRSRWRQVVAIADRVGCRLHALTTTDDGQPGHPLTLGYDCQLAPWTPRT